MNERLDEIENKLDSIHENLLILQKQIRNDVVPSTNKMSTHIDFIENTYVKVSAPLHFVCNKINRYISHDDTKKDK